MERRESSKERPAKSNVGDGARISTTLLQRIQLDDPEGWERLVQLFSPLVYKWCRSKGLDPTETRDISQDVFAAGSKGITSFKRERPNDSFRGWLWTVTINKICDYARKTKRQPRAISGSSF